MTTQASKHPSLISGKVSLHRSYPAVGHLSYIIPLPGQKDSPFSYQKQQHPAGISLIVRLKMVFQSMFYD